MGKQLLCTGPAEIFVGFLNTAGSIAAGILGAPSLVSLGWSESGVYIDNEPAFEDCMTDLSGPRVPLDVQLQGQQSYVSLDLKLFDPAVFDQVRQRAGGALGLQPGTLPPGAIGSFMGQEGQGHTLLVHPPFIAKASQAQAVRPFRFPFAFLQGPDRWDRYSASALKVHCMWRCLNFFGSDGSATNFNQDETGRPATTLL